MSDEEVLAIAQGLTEEEWGTLELNTKPYRNGYSTTLDPPLIEKGLVYRQDIGTVRLTHLGRRVWEWRQLFWGAGCGSGGNYSGASMTDEEVVKIAQGLTQDEWRILGYNMGQRGTFGHTKYDSMDKPLIKKGLLETFSVNWVQYVRFTDLGKQVWVLGAVFR
jgi:hypothetical protein